MEIEKLGFITNSKFGDFHLCCVFVSVYDAYKVSCSLDYILMCFGAWNDKMHNLPTTGSIRPRMEKMGFCVALVFWCFEHAKFILEMI